MNILVTRALALAAFVVVLVAGTAARAQVPGEVAFSGSLSTEDGPVEGNVDITFRLFDAATNGDSLWSEEQTVIAEGGLIIARLGEDSPFDAALFDGTPMWLEVEIEGEVLSPRSPIGSVPYAIRASEADSIAGLSVDDLQQRVTGTCAGAIIGINVDGTVVCESGVYASAGHNHDASYAPITHNHDTSYAPISHNHDALYYTKSELNTVGTLNAGANPVQWTKLQNVPAGFADNIDNDSGGDITGVTAGAGLTGGAQAGAATLSVSFAGNGSANACSRSDHNHDGTYLRSSQGGGDNLKTGTISAASGSGSVNFLQAFPTAPIVVITPYQPNGGVSCQLTDVDAGGFDFACNGNGGTLHWIAID